jgi:hypothetical protein
MKKNLREVYDFCLFQGIARGIVCFKTGGPFVGLAQIHRWLQPMLEASTVTRDFK